MFSSSKFYYFRPIQNVHSSTVFTEQIYSNQEYTVKPNTYFDLGTMD